MKRLSDGFLFGDLFCETGKMKKKQVIVVKKLDKMSPKKEVYISRKAVNSDSIENNNEWKESFVGNPAPQV
jgi:hypothetical protein